MKGIILALACLASTVTWADRTNALDKALGRLTVSRLEALASQRKLKSRAVVDGKMVCTYVQAGRQWTVTNALFSASGFVKPPRYSKLKLYAALTAVGKWQELEAWLKTQEVNGLNAWTAFSLAQDLSADHALFTAWLEAAKTALALDDETVAKVLKASED